MATFAQNHFLRFSARAAGLVLLLFTAALGAFAQGGVANPWKEPVPRRLHQPQPAPERSGKTSDEPLTLTPPFLENFTNVRFDLYDNVFYPDPEKWYKSNGVTLSRASGINSPDFGTAVLDGADSSGFGHDPIDFSFGYSDTLMSHYFDLKKPDGLAAYYLTFHYQRGGRNFYPRDGDSLLVYLRVKDSVFAEGVFRDTTYFEFAWGMNGDFDSDSLFYIGEILLLSDKYFHDKFQFMFVNKAVRAGAFDAWHLDYINLRRREVEIDTTYPDIGIQGLHRNLFSPHTAIPRFQFNLLEEDLPEDHPLRDYGFLTPPQLGISNLSDSARSAQLNLWISDPGNEIDLLAYQIDSISVPRQAFDTLTYTKFDTFPEAMYYNEQAVFRQEFYLNRYERDTTLNNDTLVYNLPVDSIWAYDDGEAETTFGMDSRRGFGQRFTLAPNALAGDSITLEAVWLSFFPRENTDTSMTFKLQVWNFENPNVISPLYFSDSLYKVEYGDRPNTFIRYELETTLRLLAESTTDLLIGITQEDRSPIQLGVDLNNDNSDRVFFEQNNAWQPMPEIIYRNGGTLMIRPEFGNQLPVVSRGPGADAPLTFSLYPNPTNGDALTLNCPQLNTAEPLSLRFFDAAGRLAAEQTYAAATFPLSVSAPELSPGVYFVRISAGTRGGATVKLVVVR